MAGISKNIDLESWETVEGAFHVRVTLCDGESYERVLWPLNDDDHRDLRVANLFERHSKRAYEMGHPLAGITDLVLAVETIFPELDHDLRLPV